MPRQKPQDSIENEALHRAAILVAMGRTQQSVAEELGVSASTVSRWKKDPVFIATTNSVLRDACDVANNRLRQLTSTALATIEHVMVSKENPPADRLKAAFYVLDKVLGELPHAQSIGPTDADQIARQQATVAAMDKQIADLDESWGLFQAG